MSVCDIRSRRGGAVIQSPDQPLRQVWGRLFQPADAALSAEELAQAWYESQQILRDRYGPLTDDEVARLLRNTFIGWLYQIWSTSAPAVAPMVNLINTLIQAELLTPEQVAALIRQLGEAATCTM